MSDGYADYAAMLRADESGEPIVLNARQLGATVDERRHVVRLDVDAARGYWLDVAGSTSVP